MPQDAVVSTPTVAIVGGGPAGLMLSHLLHRGGIDSVVVERRTRDESETTHRAGILEADSVRMLVETGVSDRVLREGDEHEGIDLRFGGVSHRIDFGHHIGESVWLYPQTDVFIDLADARARDGGDVRFGASDVTVHDVDSTSPRVSFTDADGTPQELRPTLVVAADGSRSECRDLVPERLRRTFRREYPFAWFGILCEAPPSAPELVYTHSERGFALISQRTPTVQRMYFQCDPGTKADDWSEEQIWDEFQARVAGEDDFHLHTGPIIDKTVLGFRSFVQEPMRYGTLLLAGDAAHTVPPTGAKGLNLALADVHTLAALIESALAADDLDVLDHYTPRALERVWRAQNFSYWMTQMLHHPGNGEGASFDSRRQLGELASVVGTEGGQRYVAECYTGWPLRK
ncbi:4-hydroxybenzoate 3-monooxygenase [Agilicoccus flavus]|uniref:4-hydroxybenzoate 3-monooxygenase n=1 Tax=Agilicoccus flavus TaxID=2775968 RepID=UPI001CF6A34B|nr:4-hydroxybenzoate 3-monooxygenase [Agilicoccus flavus]